MAMVTKLLDLNLHESTVLGDMLIHMVQIG